MDELEKIALEAAKAASDAVAKAISAYAAAGFGSHVTQPLYAALGNIDYSIHEVNS